MDFYGLTWQVIGALRRLASKHTHTDPATQSKSLRLIGLL